MTEAYAALLNDVCDDPDSARERLLHTAGMMFAEHGKDSVSTRELTKAAGANLSAIAYYFGGKDGLYEEVLAHTIQSAQESLGPIEERLRKDVEAANGDRDRLAAATAKFVHDLLHALLEQGPKRWPNQLIMREIDHPTDAFDRLHEAVFHPLHASFRMLVARAKDTDPEAQDTVILALALLGECMIFHRNGPAVLRHLDWTCFDRDKVDEIAAMVTEGLQQALDLPFGPCRKRA